MWEDVIEKKLDLLCIDLINSNLSTVQLFHKTPMQETETHICFELPFAIINPIIQVELILIEIVAWIIVSFEIIG